MQNEFKSYNRIAIDKYNGPEITEFSDMRSHYGTGRAYRIPHPHKKLTGYRSGVQTDIGDIEVHEWRRLVTELIERKGEQELFKQLLEWEKEHCLTPEENDINHDALVLHARRIFDDEAWHHFIPFNEKYRPERLKTATFTTVVTDCCQTEIKMTVKQVEGNYNHCLHCPTCKQYTKFKRMEGAAHECE